MGRRRRRVQRLDPSGQQRLGFDEAVVAQGCEGEAEPLGEAWFLPDDGRGLRVQGQPLGEYLIERGLKWVVELRALVEAMDFGALTRSYSRWGRRALHPRTLLGLIIYGVQRRQWSLRELEVLAKCDAGAWLMCGGHQPDHSTIGKFIHMHREALSDEFYVDLVQQVARKLNLRPGVAALDGTAIEAASSRFRLLREEAARAAAEQAQAAAAAEQAAAAAAAGQAPAAAPESALARQARQTQEAAAAAEERNERRHAAGLKGEIKVAATEPEAVYQPRKDGVRRACYKPSVLVEQSQVEGESGPFKVQLIAAQGVHPSSEPALFNRLVDQHHAGLGCDPITLLTDAGYASLAILAASCERELDLLCPTGRARGNGDWAKRGKAGLFGKAAFAYDQEHDLYRCPAGRELLPEQRHNTDRAQRSYVRYKGVACQDCPLRAQCTKSASARTLKRYSQEEFKEGMLAVMAQPAARARYRLRGEIVERVFAELRERQGLKRFHRRGLLGVRAEFALHCIAFNLKQAVACLGLVFLRFPVGLYGACGSQCRFFAVVILVPMSKSAAH